MVVLMILMPGAGLYHQRAFETRELGKDLRIKGSFRGSQFCDQGLGIRSRDVCILEKLRVLVSFPELLSIIHLCLHLIHDSGNDRIDLECF